MPRLLTLAVAAGLVLPWPAPQEQQPVFRSAIRTVAVYATVSDAQGRLVPNLERGAFTVVDNGRPVDITVFSNQPEPVTVAVMLDMSNSMVGNVLLVRAAMEQFVQNLLPHDRARIGTFGEEVWISPLLSADSNVLTRVLREELWPGGGTPMWHGLDVAVSSLAGESGRRVALVLTDGADTGGLTGWGGSPAGVRRQAIEQSVMVYGILLEGLRASASASPDARLLNLVDETGGGHFQLEQNADLAATFTRVAEELRHQYLLGFSPASLDGELHNLRVQARGDGLKVRFRKTYLAVPGQ